MAIKYATYSEFSGFYSPKGITQDEIENFWLVHGSLVVNERLGGHFTIPFSSNNETAKDLSIHFSYLGILNKTRNQTDSQELKTYLDERIASIVSSGTAMVTTDGFSIKASNGNPRTTAWSNTQDYNPVFDHREAIYQRVDPDLIEDEFDRDF